MKSPVIFTLACAAALSLACNTPANDTVVNDPAVNDTVGTSGDLLGLGGGDRDFVHDMMESGTAEVQLGNMARERGASADVKQFGETLVRDHTQANEQLKQIAMQHDLQPGEVTIDDEHRELIDRLSRLQGAEFDREFIAAMVDGHEDAIDKLQGRVAGRCGQPAGEEPEPMGGADAAGDSGASGAGARDRRAARRPDERTPVNALRRLEARRARPAP
jgi:putative membrane protein